MPTGVSYWDNASTGQVAVTLKEASATQVERSLALYRECWYNHISNDPVATQRRYLDMPFMSSAAFYVLVPAGAPETKDLIACTLLVKLPLLCLRPGNDKTVIEVGELAEAFAVDPRARGRGYAVKAAQLMAEQRHNNPKSIFAVIGWSECGQHIWAAAGGKLSETSEYHAIVDEFSKSETLDGTEPLSLDRIVDLLPFDIADIKARLAKADPLATRFAILPTRELYECTYQRIRDTLTSLRGSSRLPTTLGARVDNANFTFWTHQLIDRQLHLIRFVQNNITSARRLLSAAVQEAAWWDLQSVVVWDIDQKLANDLGMISIARDFNLPMCICPGEPSARWEVCQRYGLMGL